MYTHEKAARAHHVHHGYDDDRRRVIGLEDCGAYGHRERLGDPGQKEAAAVDGREGRPREADERPEEEQEGQGHEGEYGKFAQELGHKVRLDLVDFGRALLRQDVAFRRERPELLKRRAPGPLGPPGPTPWAQAL